MKAIKRKSQIQCIKGKPILNELPVRVHCGKVMQSVF